MDYIRTDLPIQGIQVATTNFSIHGKSKRTKLSFGSFGANFGVTTIYVNGPMSDKSSTSLSEISQGIEESVDEQASRFVMIDCERNVERERERVKYNTFLSLEIDIKYNK